MKLIRTNILKIYSNYFSRHHTFWFLLLLGLLFFFLRMPSLFEPNWYGDEGIYQVVGRALNNGWVLYRDIWDNKPPFLYLLYAYSFGSLFIVKLYSMIFGLLSIVAFFFLANKLFEDSISLFVSTLIFTLMFGLPIIEGNIANAENFMLLPILISSYLVVNKNTSRKYPFLILSGLLLSIAAMFKIVAIFDLTALVIFILFSGKNLRTGMRKVVTMCASFVIIPSFTFLYFYFNKAGSDFINGVFLQNVSYVGEQFGSANPKVMILFKLILLLISVISIFIIRKKITKSSIFIFLIASFSVFNAFFSDRPYIHYMLVILPSFSLIVASLFLHKKVRIINVVFILFIIVFAFYHFNIYRKNISYYENFISYIFGYKDVREYQEFFDKNTPRDYLIANYITTHTNQVDDILLLTDSAQIYALSNKLPISKYTVFYHMTYYPDAMSIIKNAIDIKKPKLIIQTVESSKIYQLTSSYKLKYIIEGAKIYERQI